MENKSFKSIFGVEKKELVKLMEFPELEKLVNSDELENNDYDPLDLFNLKTTAFKLRALLKYNNSLEKIEKLLNTNNEHAKEKFNLSMSILRKTLLE